VCDRIVISTDGCFLFCGVVCEIIFVAVSLHLFVWRATSLHTFRFVSTQD